MTNRAIDSHCHLNFQAYERDWKQVVENNLRSGTDMIIVATDLATSKRAIEIAKLYSGVWATVGFHPIHVINRDWRVEILEIAKLTSHPKVVAIGEIGFDRYRMPEGNIAEIIKIQERVFDFLVGEAVRVNKPIIIHNREAMDILMDKLPELKKLKASGVQHCFPGNLTQAKKLFEIGFKIGFTGMITYNDTWDNLITRIPLENILIETDSPFLTPVPYRGERNKPKNVIEVAKHIASLKACLLDDVISQTYQNTKEVFGLL